MNKCLFLWITLAALIIGAQCKVQIKNMKVPAVIQEGDRESIILDCEYEIDTTETMVLKWFFNNQPKPFYQWIVGNKPTANGPFKEKINLGYEASQNETEKYRAVQIKNPTFNMSGTYLCLVSTFGSEDRKNKNMLIYVEGRNFLLNQEKTEDTVTINCFAQSIFPKPNMTIFTGANEPAEGTEVNVISNPDGLFDITARVTLKKDDLDESPVNVFCDLTIPEANYTRKKEALYYPGGEPTTAEPLPSSDYNLDPSGNATTGSASGRLIEAPLSVLVTSFLCRYLLGVRP